MKEQQWPTDENPDGLDPARGVIYATIAGIFMWILIGVTIYCLVEC